MDLSSKVWWANEIRIWGTGLTAMVGVVTFLAGWVGSRWQSELATEQRDTAVAVQQASDERIAAATAQAADAGARAAEANKQAAEANLKAEQERLARLEIEAQLAPRMLSEKQIETVKAQLTELGPVSFTLVTYGQDEPLNLSHQILKALAESGWNYVPKNASPGFNVAGVYIRYGSNSDKNIQEAAKRLSIILENAKIRTQKLAMETILDNSISIAVGTKP